MLREALSTEGSDAGLKGFCAPRKMSSHNGFLELTLHEEQGQRSHAVRGLQHRRACAWAEYVLHCHEIK